MTPTNDPIDVAIDIGPLYGHRTGVGVAVEGMSRALDERSDVRLDPYLLSLRADLQPGHRKLPVPGIVASHAWSRGNRPGADRWLEGVDLVHGTNYVAPPCSKPTVVSVYDCWFLRHPELADPLVRRAGATLRRRVDDGAWVHTSSDATTAQIAELLGTDRVATVHLGPPSKIDEVSDPPTHVAGLRGTAYVLAIGTEERRKDLPTLIAAFAELGAASPSVALVLAGAPGNQSPAVDEAIDALPNTISGRVHRLGVIDTETKAWLLRHAAVLAYPSLDEGFGFPVLEAQSAGVPVVASDVGSIAEIAGAGIALVPARSPSAFAAELGAVIDGTRSRLELITAGHENVGRFSWAATANGLVDLYRRAIETS